MIRVGSESERCVSHTVGAIQFSLTTTTGYSMIHLRYAICKELSG